MRELRVLPPEELVAEVRQKVRSKPHQSNWHDFKIAPDPVEPPPYTLILGAGFSYGVVPLTRQLMEETIGGYYIPDQDQWGERPAGALRKHSATFWAEFNRAAKGKGLHAVVLDGRGLPVDVGEAYRTLFAYQGVNELFAGPEPKLKTGKMSYLERMIEARGQQPLAGAQEPSQDGARFLKGFLRYVLLPGSEHGLGLTGRNELNPAHVCLAKLLGAQQSGEGWVGSAFCRTIFTTNFDTLLQVAMQKANLVPLLTDRPERRLDPTDFPEEEEAIHLVYAHGSILRHNPASAASELAGLAEQNVEVLSDFLQKHDVITIGYGGWEDGLMAALRRCDATRHKLYWCDVRSDPYDHIVEFLNKKGEGALYVTLGKDGANGLMQSLCDALIEEAD